METIEQTSSIITNAVIQKKFVSDRYAVSAHVNILSDAIESINLSTMPAEQTTQINSLGLYARADWNQIGQTSYYFSDVVDYAERSAITALFDQIFRNLKTQQP